MAGTNYVDLQSVDFDKLRLETVDRLTFLDKTDNSVLLIMEDLKDFTISNGVDTVYQTGKLGVRLAAYDRNKNTSGSGSNGYVVASAIAAQVGSDVELASDDAPLEVPCVELLTVPAPANAGDPMKVTLTYKAAGTSGAEFPFVYMANSDLTQGAKYSIAATASTTEFAYDPTTRTITLPTGVFSAGDVVIVPYTRTATVGKKITNSAENMAKSGKCILDCTGSEICDQSKKYHVIFEFPFVKINGAFDLAFGDEPMSQPFGFDSMADPCSVQKELWNLYIA